MPSEAKQFVYADILVGQIASFVFEVTEETISSFAKLSGDLSPIHVDEQYAKETEFGASIAHGMIAGMIFSRMVGMELPGKYSIYLSQQLNFHIPIFKGDTLTVRGEVIQKSDALKIVTLVLQVYNQREVLCTDGKALVKMLK